MQLPRCGDRDNRCVPFYVQLFCQTPTAEIWVLTLLCLLFTQKIGKKFVSILEILYLPCSFIIQMSVFIVFKT